jgi:hypothetical protein
MKNKSSVMALEVHSMFRGDANSAVKKLVKNKIHGHVVNAQHTPRLEFIPVSQLVPLDTQRETGEVWVSKRLKDRKGFDMLAAGALSVALDPSDNVYYVFDGCGRLAQAQLNRNPATLSCLVYDIPKAQAAYYFAYNQDRGRRNLSKEVIFVNQVFSGDEEALVWEDRLRQLGLYIKGATDYPVPHPQATAAAEIKYHGLIGGFAIAKTDMVLMRLARDMICTAWGTSAIIKPGIYWGLIMLLREYPAVQDRAGVYNKAFQNFLTSSALLQSHYHLSMHWNDKGDNQTNGRAISVALGMLREFRKSNQCPAKYKNSIFNEAALKRLSKSKDPINEGAAE